MDGTITATPLRARWRKPLDLLARLDANPYEANWVLVTVWVLTRGALLLGLVIGQHYADPQFYNYAGRLAAGDLPYRDFAVEYPPLAMVLLLLPALVLLPFGGVAPRLDPVFAQPLTHIPAPDPIRYAAYGQAFAVEMLLIDVLTLWLVRGVAMRLAPTDPVGLRAGLLYLGLVFASGALLQKFDLAAGTLCLMAILALMRGHRRLAWTALALAALVKGFPLFVAPIFVFYLLGQCDQLGLRDAIRLRARQLAEGAAWFIGTIAVPTLLVWAFAGVDAILHTLTYQSARGTEIESLYANVQLVLGWLPGVHVDTRFNPADLSRVVLSPLDQFSDTASLALTAVLLLAVYALAWRASWRGGVRASGAAGGIEDAGDMGDVGEASNRQTLVLVAGVVGVLLAFMLGFRALPAHYLLLVLPLIAVLRLPSARQTAIIVACAAGVAVAGQLLTITRVWESLKQFAPWAVALLSLRNLCWLGLLALTLVGLWRWGSRHVVLAPEKPNARLPSRLVRAPRRTISVTAGRLLRSTPPIPGFTPRGEDVFAHLLAHVAPERLVIASGVVSALIYGGLVLAFPITLWWSHPHAADDPNVINDMGRITHHSFFAAAAFVLAIIALFACQFFALIAAGRVHQSRDGGGRRDTLVRWSVLLFPVVFILLMIWMQPVTTTDLYGYVARGYLFAHVHQNPMILKASLLPGGFTVDRPEAPYGPAWLLIAAVVSLLGGESLLANMLIFKVIAAASAVAAIWLVDLLARRLFPERRLRILVLFAWSPLLLFEAIGNGHNDIVMMVCMLAAVCLMLRGNAQASFALLVLGALIKYVSAVLVPLWLVYELQHRARKHEPAAIRPEASLPERRRRLWGIRSQVRAAAQSAARSLETLDRREAAVLLINATVIGLTMVMLCYAPFWVGLRTFSGLGNQLRPLYYNGSIVAFITAPLKVLVQPEQWEPLDKTVRLVFYTLFGVYTLLQVRRLWMLGPASNLRDVITAAAKIVFAALILITFWFQPWYVIWLLPLAALSNETFVRRQGIILSLGALLTYAVSNYVSVGETDISRDLFVQFFIVLVAFGPLLILRVAPYDQGLLGVLRRYAGLLGRMLTFEPLLWERLVLVLAVVVGALLRLLGLGNLTTQLGSGSNGVSALKEISGDLRLALADPQGLHGPFVAIQQFLVQLFGATPLAALLPSALIGAATVLVIYFLTVEIMRQGQWRGARTVGVLAALLAATSRWHVSLSRSGMEVVLLPLLMCLALYCLLLAFRMSAAVATPQPQSQSQPQPQPQPTGDSPAEGGARPSERRSLLLYAACGVCTGLACDLAPGLWLLPILVVGFLLVWRWQRPQSITRLPLKLAVLVGTALVAGIPAIGYFLSRSVGLPTGSPVLARSSVNTPSGPGPLSPEFWGQVIGNVGDVLRVLVAQDYTSGYPAVGTSPIIPFVLTPIFLIGVIIIVMRWRNMTAMALLLLIALPLVASVAVGTPTGVIQAASVLPATCIVPALALYEIGVFLGHLPIVLDRMTGARVFTNPEQIGRLLLLLFLVASALRTFFWYFEATLPASPSQYNPSYTGSQVSLVVPRGEGRSGGDIDEGVVWRAELPSGAHAAIVLVRVPAQVPVQVPSAGFSTLSAHLVEE
jgi:4-amino-4-deoxy-L-arabinose transferase-like glycosyltransferase